MPGQAERLVGQLSALRIGDALLWESLTEALDRAAARLTVAPCQAA